MSSSENPDHETELEPSDAATPQTGYVLRAETGHFTVTGFPVGMTVEGPPESLSGRRVESKPATGGFASSHSDANGTTSAVLHAPLARGRANEAHTLKLVMQAMRTRGDSVNTLEGARDDRGEDHLLEIEGKRLAVQVVTLPVDEKFWRELATTQQVQAAWSLEEAVSVVRDALEHKRGKARGALLVLDASHIGAMLSPRLIDAYSRRHKSVEAEYQVAECWIVGPTKRSVFRIP